MKYLGTNLPKETKELSTENYKTLMKEIKDNINIWRDIPYFQVGRINIVKITNVIYRFNVILLKLPWTFFIEIEEKNLTIRMEIQKTPKSQGNKKNKILRNIST